MTRHVFVITESKKMDGWASGFTFRPFSNEYKNEDRKKQIQSSFMKILSSMFDISETSWVWAWMQWWVVSDSQWHCGNASLARQWVARCTCHHISGTRGQDTQTRHSVLSGLWSHVSSFTPADAFLYKDTKNERLQIMLAGWLDNLLGSRSAVPRSPLYLSHVESPLFLASQ